MNTDNNRRDSWQELKDRRREENRTYVLLISLISLFLALILLGALQDHIYPLLFKAGLGMVVILFFVVMSKWPTLPKRQHKRNNRS